MKVWVLMEEGYDWQELIGVYTDENMMNEEYDRRNNHLRDDTPGGYGLAIYETELIYGSPTPIVEPPK